MNSSVVFTQPYKVVLATLLLLISVALLITGFVIKSLAYIFASTLPIMISSCIILLIYFNSEPEKYPVDYQLNY